MARDISTLAQTFQQRTEFGLSRKSVTLEARHGDRHLSAPSQRLQRVELSRLRPRLTRLWLRRAPDAY